MHVIPPHETRSDTGPAERQETRGRRSSNGHLARDDRTGIARILLLLIALAFLANMAAGIFHAGVEWKWWPGPGECSGAFELQWGQGGVIDTPIIRCDEASWRFLGLSFAGWNAMVSAFLTLVAAYGASQRR